MVPFTWSKAAKKVYPSALQYIASSTSDIAFPNISFMHCYLVAG
ncbi:hypothetical protein APHWI1_0030 [Anaplasma phagocytophilum str. ApWI1]|uniref:Uncharacterized protein n=2 Tax=Anaplasma phagocytophilum TaxID=948 RepID=A0A0F3PYL2_ANAPH|nr:hypothetical protein APHWEB_1482 [Anaplasma phagocytophilum str. Webster]KJV64464.1 hypothetical protein APHMUC_0216 [Anaplasma phagocytophilum str. ApMUC09]KJV83080.1 hypothetical protein APHHGE2_0829 [Anaplasma phagocytophilum str. HGE2]KJV85057.1 hypothetical protein APHWI1_0030 [Anaplasma phagocytophilum str. ApWI1]KJV87636.1 hypothetical protein APHNYW_0561 [Anaplasma phagocytophilum str. ApNYW]KJV98999.1 hypothetical protein OTSANNIE_0799 [Anaplasma phagocytophilum str. Annie]KJZ9806